jgi:hypothetical protein
MNTKHVAIAGLGRCGTTLVMHMLHAAGVPCIGTKPGFEVKELARSLIDRDLFDQHPGHAFKWLDPHHAHLPATVEIGLVIWLNREPGEQARSQAKFANQLGGRPFLNRAGLRALRRQLLTERVQALNALSAWPKVFFQFESILAAPVPTAEKIATALEPFYGGLDPRLMAAKVRQRSPLCAPDFSIELELSDEAKAAAA